MGDPVSQAFLLWGRTLDGEVSDGWGLSQGLLCKLCPYSGTFLCGNLITPAFTGQEQQQGATVWRVLGQPVNTDAGWANKGDAPLELILAKKEKLVRMWPSVPALAVKSMQQWGLRCQRAWGGPAADNRLWIPEEKTWTCLGTDPGCSMGSSSDGEGARSSLTGLTEQPPRSTGMVSLSTHGKKHSSQKRAVAIPWLHITFTSSLTPPHKFLEPLMSCFQMPWQRLFPLFCNILFPLLFVYLDSFCYVVIQFL